MSIAEPKPFSPKGPGPRHKRFWHDRTALQPGVDDFRLLYSVQPRVAIDQFENLLFGYGYEAAKTQFLVDSLRYGFDLGYTGNFEACDSNNLISAISQPQILSELIDKEVRLGRFLGPYTAPPFTPQRINPLGLIPKKSPNSYRLIVDLSQPVGNSVNDHITRESSRVQYPSLQDAIDIILSLHDQGYKPVLFKLDIQSAFRLLPLSPDNFPLMGLRFNGFYYVDAFLPMGSSSSCRIFQNFSDSIAFLMHHHAGVDHVINYLDDFLGIECSMSVAPDKVRNSMLMGEKLGIPFAPDKCEGPTPVLTFLGIELDCVNLEARLPQVKISKAINLIQSFLQSPRQRYSRLESLHGFLNHCAEIIPAGKAFLRSLQRLLHPSSSHWVTVPSQVVFDLQTWLIFLQNYNGKTMFVRSGWDLPSVLLLETDSSGSWGCAAVFQGQYFAIQWPPQVNRSNLSLLEFYPIVVATFVWSAAMSNKRLIIHCDNLASVFIVNKLKALDEATMSLVRLFALHCLQSNIWFQARHIPGATNHGPDALSRGRFQEFHRAYPDITPLELTLPLALQPLNCLPH